METQTQNHDIWNYNINVRENVTLTIGTIFWVLAPRQVEVLLVVYIPLLVSKFKSVILNSTSTYFTVSIYHHIQGSTIFSFFITVEKLIITGFAPLAAYFYGFIFIYNTSTTVLVITVDFCGTICTIVYHLFAFNMVLRLNIIMIIHHSFLISSQKLS